MGFPPTSAVGCKKAERAHRTTAPPRKMASEFPAEMAPDERTIRGHPAHENAPAPAAPPAPLVWSDGRLRTPARSTTPYIGLATTQLQGDHARCSAYATGALTRRSEMRERERETELARGSHFPLPSESRPFLISSTTAEIRRGRHQRTRAAHRAGQSRTVCAQPIQIVDAIGKSIPVAAEVARELQKRRKLLQKYRSRAHLRASECADEVVFANHGTPGSTKTSVRFVVVGHPEAHPRERRSPQAVQLESHVTGHANHKRRAPRICELFNGWPLSCVTMLRDARFRRGWREGCAGLLRRDNATTTHGRRLSPSVLRCEDERCWPSSSAVLRERPASARALGRADRGHHGSIKSAPVDATSRAVNVDAFIPRSHSGSQIRVQRTSARVARPLSLDSSQELGGEAQVRIGSQVGNSSSSTNGPMVARRASGPGEGPLLARSPGNVTEVPGEERWAVPVVGTTGAQ